MKRRVKVGLLLYVQGMRATLHGVVPVVCVCVCACPPVMRGDTVKHALTSTSSPPNDVPSIPWSPVVLPLWTPLGGLLEWFPMDLCISSDVGLRGSCCWATPQPRNLSLQVINTGTLCTGTAPSEVVLCPILYCIDVFQLI